MQGSGRRRGLPPLRRTWYGKPLFQRPAFLLLADDPPHVEPFPPVAVSPRRSRRPACRRTRRPGLFRPAAAGPAPFSPLLPPAGARYRALLWLALQPQPAALRPAAAGPYRAHPGPVPAKPRPARRAAAAAAAQPGAGCRLHRTRPGHSGRPGAPGSDRPAGRRRRPAASAAPRAAAPAGDAAPAPLAAAGGSAGALQPAVPFRPAGQRRTAAGLAAAPARAPRRGLRLGDGGSLLSSFCRCRFGPRRRSPGGCRADPGGGGARDSPRHGLSRRADRPAGPPGAQRGAAQARPPLHRGDGRHRPFQESQRPLRPRRRRPGAAMVAARIWPGSAGGGQPFRYGGEEFTVLFPGMDRGRGPRRTSSGCARPSAPQDSSCAARSGPPQTGAQASRRKRPAPAPLGYRQHRRRRARRRADPARAGDQGRRPGPLPGQGGGRNQICTAAEKGKARVRKKK